MPVVPYSQRARRRPTRETIFVSSGDEVKDHRRFFKAMQEGVGRALRENQVDVDLVIETWEGATAARVPPGHHGNDRFVELARGADLTCVLLGTELGVGTREELEAVLAEDEVELAILVCVRQDDEWPPGELGDYLRDLVRRDVVFVAKVGRLDDPDDPHGVRRGIVQVIFDRVLKAQAEHEETLRESR